MPRETDANTLTPMNAGTTQLADEAAPQSQSATSQRASYAIYALAIAASIGIWLLAVRAPLGLDETGSYWQISAGLSQIWPRQFIGLGFPAYPYILWFFTKLIGASELALRIPSVLAMLGAAFLLYRSARELFAKDISLIATFLFCVNPIVAFEAVDVRPYAFAILVTNAAILLLLRLRRSDSFWLAALFGVFAALIPWFHHLFATILPAMLACAIAFKIRAGRTGAKQLGTALAAFCVTFLPLIPGLKYLFHTAHSHVYESSPKLAVLLLTVALGWAVPSFVFAGLSSLAARYRRPEPTGSFEILVCLSLGLIPVLLLWGISAGTPIHMFAERHRLVAIPGLALCWALAVSRLRGPAAKRLFAGLLTFITIAAVLFSGNPGHHYDSWKQGMQAVEKFTAADHAPVMMCSAFIESDFYPMPAESPKLHSFFAPLTYYKISSPIVPLPQDFNSETIRVASAFLQKAARDHQRFLVAAEIKSHPTVHWIEQAASETFTVRELGRYGVIEIIEFTPIPSS
jgi:hypothetical protein